MLISTDMTSGWIMVMLITVTVFWVKFIVIERRLQHALKRTQRLEQETAVATRLVQLLVGQLQVAGDVDTLGPELTRVLAACDDKQLRGIVQRIDLLMKTKQRTNAVRQYRDLLACTWDEALEAIEEWGSLSSDQKMAWIYTKKAHQALKQPIDLLSLQPA